MPKNDFENWSKKEFIDEITKLRKRKKYGIIWEEKPEAVALLCKEKLPVLIENQTKSLVMEKEKTNNILIEGDNYHALSVLNYTHKNKIDVIYIDPPYNTGSGDSFRYNDKLVDKEDSYRHSKWLSFIEKRLKLAKGLLRSCGVIFISIDDNELAQLKILCDEIFSENNFVANIVRRRRKTQANLSKNISPVHEYILAYAKNIQKLEFNKLSYTPEAITKGFSNPDADPRGLYQTGPLARPANSKNKEYVLAMPNGRMIKAKWSCSQETFNRYVKENRLIIPRGGEGMPRIKIFLNELTGSLPNTWWDAVATNEEGAREIENFFGTVAAFEYPKPVNLIKQILKISSKKDATILDFFAGSGTTGQAVLDLNKEDGGKRNFILCTNNENNIAIDVCYPRIAKVIKGYTAKDGNKVMGTNANLRYFTTDFIDAEPTDRNKKKLVEKSTEMLCLREDCFEEYSKGNGYKIFKNPQGKNLGIIYDDDGIEPFKKLVKSSSEKYIVYVFSLDETAREEEFKDVAKLVELKPIPEVILNVYRRIFK